MEDENLNARYAEGILQQRDRHCITRIPLMILVSFSFIGTYGR